MDYPQPKVIISLEEYEMLKEAKKSFDELSEEHRLLQRFVKNTIKKRSKQ